MREIHASRGIVTTKIAAEETRTYTIRNVDQKAKTLIIEHPLRPAIRCSTRSPRKRPPPTTALNCSSAPARPRSSWSTKSGSTSSPWPWST